MSKSSRAIDIVEFVERSEISPIYYDKPYYLVPLKNGQRAYALLRDVMKKSEKVGIAKIVIRTRQHSGRIAGRRRSVGAQPYALSPELRDVAKFD